MPAKVGDITSYYWYCAECSDGTEDYADEREAETDANDHNQENHA